MPAWPVTEIRRARRSRAVAWKKSFSSRSSSSRPTNGASRPSARPCPPRFATTRRARQAGTGAVLPLQHLLAGLLERDRAGCVARQVGSPTSTDARRRDRLEPAGGVDEVAGDHALARRTDGDCRLAGEHRSPRFEAAAIGARIEAAYRLDEVERRPDGTLGVVLLGDRRAPDGHHGVADELLDGAAVALHDVARGVEVAGQEFAHRLGVTIRGERRESHEVREEDGDNAAFRCRRGCGRRRHDDRGLRPRRCCGRA